MEFNNHNVSGASTNFDAIKAKYAAAGRKMPTLVFWRVDVKVQQQPVVLTDKNTVLVNGYSPSILSTILSMDVADVTPMSLMYKALGTKYDVAVHSIFS